MNFKPDSIETPYMRARQEYDDLIGGARVQARNWRMASFILMLVLSIAIIGMIYQSTRATILPYIVEVNKMGSVRMVGRVDNTKYRPTEAAKKHFVNKFVFLIRGISSDPVVLKKNFLSAYNYVTTSGRQILNDYAKEYDPFLKIKTLRVSVELANIVKINKNSYQVQWIEKVYSKNGGLLETNNYLAVFNTIIQKPKNETILLANPLGIFIDFFNITKQA